MEISDLATIAKKLNLELGVVRPALVPMATPSDACYNLNMDFELTNEQQRLVEQNGIVQTDKVIVMSMSVYHEMMGIATDADLQDSLQKIDEGTTEHENGQGIPLDQFIAQRQNRRGTQN